MTHLVIQYGYLAVLAIVGLESLGVPLPGETTLISAALLAGATHQLNIAGVIAAATAGAIIGDNAGYLLGHWGGYRLLVRFGPYVHLDQAKVKVAHFLFLRHGGKVVFFGRFVSILRTYAAFLAGTARMRWTHFLLFNAAGGFLWAALYGLAAFALGNEVDRLSRPLAMGFGAAGAVAVLAAILFVRANEQRLERVAEETIPGPLPGYPGGAPLRVSTQQKRGWPDDAR